MCALFGIIDYANYFNRKQKNIILSVLSTECEIRGTDATGIAYNVGEALKVFKRPISAHQMRYLMPENVKVIMGHTRMTTQGDEAKNYNNHPFLGSVGNTDFAFAHNGIIYNDDTIIKSHKLPKTKIETDSYIGVQLIEKEKSLTFESLAKMAETVRGNFTFTILDSADNLYFIKGDNPICIAHFASRGFYLYASTDEILDETLKRLGVTNKEYERVVVRCGEILRIDVNGKRTTSEFDTIGVHSSYYGYFRPHSYRFNEGFRDVVDGEHLSMVKSMASAFGYTSGDVDDMLADGYTLAEVEEMFYEDETVYQ